MRETVWILMSIYPDVRKKLQAYKISKKEIIPWQ